MKTHKIKTQTYINYVGGTLSMCGVHNKVLMWNRSSRWEKVDCERCLKHKRAKPQYVCDVRRCQDPNCPRC